MRLFFLRTAMLFFTMFHALITHAHPVLTESSDVLTQQLILQYVNEYRVAYHLAPLVLNTKISKEAAGHSAEMASKQVAFGHAYFQTRIQHIYHDIPHCQAGAENVAYYKQNAKNLVAAWIASPGHRRNILGNYNLTGIGIAHASKRGWAYYTQIFIRKS